MLVEELSSLLEKEALLPPQIEWSTQRGSSSELDQLDALHLVLSDVSLEQRNDFLCSEGVEVNLVLP
jgi:hypothetical protein